MKHYDDVNTSTVALIGVLGAVVLFVIIVALQALFYGIHGDEVTSKMYARSDTELATVRAEDLERLNSYGWINEREGQLRIPIDRAMELVYEEAAAGGSGAGMGTAAR